MDIALVTGADRGIGLQIARELVGIGFRVYGLAADFSTCTWDHHDFMRVACDLASVEHLRRAWEHIQAHDASVCAVVHAAPAPELPADFETSAWEDVAHVVHSGLLAPLLLTRWALPSLIRQRGHVINIGWNGGGASAPCALEAAVQGGRYHWAQGLFHELRDTGVKVCTVYPQANPGEDAKARLRVDPQSAVDARLVAQTVVQVVQFRQNNLIAELVVRPQATREQPRIAMSVEPLLRGPKDIVLPDPDKRPPAPEPIPTPERQRPDDAWDLDDDDWDEDDFEEDEDDELDALMESSRRLLKEQNDAARRQLERTRQKGSAAPSRGGERARPNEADRRREGDSQHKRRERLPAEEQTQRRSDHADPRSRGRGQDAAARLAGSASVAQAAADTAAVADNPAGASRADAAVDAPRVSVVPGAEDVRHAAGTASVSEQTEGAVGAEGDAAGEDAKRRRRRRRGGRGRNRNRDHDFQDNRPSAEGEGRAADRNPAGDRRGAAPADSVGPRREDGRHGDGRREDGRRERNDREHRDRERNDGGRRDGEHNGGERRGAGTERNLRERDHQPRRENAATSGEVDSRAGVGKPRLNTDSAASESRGRAGESARSSEGVVPSSAAIGSAAAVPAAAPIPAAAVAGRERPAPGATAAGVTAAAARTGQSPVPAAKASHARSENLEKTSGAKPDRASLIPASRAQGTDAAAAVSPAGSAAPRKRAGVAKKTAAAKTSAAAESSARGTTGSSAASSTGSSAVSPTASPVASASAMVRGSAAVSEKAPVSLQPPQPKKTADAATPTRRKAEKPADSAAADVPARKTAVKKAATKKTATRKTAAKKATVRKATSSSQASAGE